MTSRDGIAMLASLVATSACSDSLVVVGVVDAPESQHRTPVPNLAPAVSGTHPATIECPARADVAEKVASLEASSDLIRFAASDDHVVYATKRAGHQGSTTTLWLATSAMDPAVIDEASAESRGSILIDSDHAYWSLSSVRRAPFANGEAPRSLVDKPSFAVHRLAPDDIIVPADGQVQRVQGDAPPTRALWANVPDDDPAAWAVTSRHAYWVSERALYRADLATLTQEAVHPGPISGGLTADERHVYWVDVTATGSVLRALDGDDVDVDPVSVSTWSERSWPYALHATRSAVFVLSESSIVRVDRATGTAVEVLEGIAPIDLAFPPTFSPCSVVYRKGSDLWRRPLPQSP